MYIREDTPPTANFWKLTLHSSPPVGAAGSVQRHMSQSPAVLAHLVWAPGDDLQL